VIDGRAARCAAGRPILEVGPSGVCGAWLRHDLETRHKRLRRLERQSHEATSVLSEEQIALLERHSVDFHCRHIEASRPGALLVSAKVAT
jgi:hypothetical protein